MNNFLRSLFVRVAFATAQAQQPKKVSRIGYLAWLPSISESTRAEAISAGVCASLAT